MGKVRLGVPQAIKEPEAAAEGPSLMCGGGREGGRGVLPAAGTAEAPSLVPDERSDPAAQETEAQLADRLGQKEDSLIP